MVCYCPVIQHHRGHPPRDEVWVFGMVDTSTTPAHGYMEVVQRRDAVTLLPIIQGHVRPGTIIYSDQWSAYRHVGALPNVSSHSTVNHSLHFKDPVTGVHTNNIESYRELAKGKLKKMKGCKHEFIPSYLDEFLWKDKYGGSSSAVFASLLRDIVTQYPV